VIKEVLNPPSCSECGTALVYGKFQKTHKNKLQEGWFGYDPELARCTNCGQLTDIILRTAEDHKHAEYHRLEVDPLGRLDPILNEWVYHK